MSSKDHKNKQYIKDYLIKERIGVGSYGLVFKVTKRNKSEVLVLKQIPFFSKDNQKQIDEIQNEAKLLSQLDSKFIVKYYESFEENNNIDIVMEYCEGGDLSSYLINVQKRTSMLVEERIWKIFIQMSIGLEYLHSRKILHRDLKSMNIFLTKSLDVKIGDLGVAKLLQNTSHAHTFIGTPFYLSPEVCEEKPYNDKSDIWALGCIAYEMATFKHPYEASNHAALFLKIINGKHEPVSSKYSEDLRRLIDILLEKDYTKRPSMNDIIKMPCFITKAKQLGLYEDVVNVMEKNTIGKALKTPVKAPKSNTSTNLNINVNINNISNSKDKSDAFGKKKFFQSQHQQKIQTNMIDYNYLKFKEKAQVNKVMIKNNSNPNVKIRKEISHHSAVNENNNNPPQQPKKKNSPNKMNLLPSSNISVNVSVGHSKGKQSTPMKSESHKMITSPSNRRANYSKSIYEEEEGGGYKNKYIISKRSTPNTNDTKHSSAVNTSANSSRVYTGNLISNPNNYNNNKQYHQRHINSANSSNIRVRKENEYTKATQGNGNNFLNSNHNYITSPVTGTGIDKDNKFTPGIELNNFINELKQKSFIVSSSSKDNYSNSNSNYNKPIQPYNNDSCYSIEQPTDFNYNYNHHAALLKKKIEEGQGGEPMPLWNSNNNIIESNDDNDNFQVIEAKQNFGFKSQPHFSPTCNNDISYDDGEYNNNHRNNLNQNDNEEDDEEQEEKVSIIPNSVILNEKKDIEKENNELMKKIEKSLEKKTQYYHEITQYSSLIDTKSLFDIYDSSDYNDIDKIKGQIEEYINNNLPSKTKADEVSNVY